MSPSFERRRVGAHQFCWDGSVVLGAPAAAGQGEDSQYADECQLAHAQRPHVSAGTAASQKSSLRPVELLTISRLSSVPFASKTMTNRV